MSASCEVCALSDINTILNTRASASVTVWINMWICGRACSVHFGIYRDMNKKGKRETATKNVRIYPSTLKVAQVLSIKEGKTIARIIDEKIKK